MDKLLFSIVAAAALSVSAASLLAGNGRGSGGPGPGGADRPAPPLDALFIGPAETPAGQAPVADAPHPMSIAALRAGEYPGGPFVPERRLADGTNYRQMVVSYRSEGLKIYGLLTVPKAEKPADGFPAVLFVHGYIPPDEYSTTGNYPTYQAALARGGFITFKPDLRGHGDSEGEAVNTHYSEKYVVDALNALAYLKQHPDADPERLGYWGHSNGGEIGLRAVLASPDIKAASFWAGVVGSYEDMFETYNAKIPFLQDVNGSSLVKEHGLPGDNPDFWGRLEPYAYLPEITAALQVQHAAGDERVPVELSRRLREGLERAGKKPEYFEYAGDDHNISANAPLAWRRTIDFFGRNL